MLRRRVRYRGFIRLGDRFAVGIDGRVPEGDTNLAGKLVCVLQSLGHLMHLGVGDVLLRQVCLPDPVSPHQADGPLATALRSCPKGPLPSETSCIS